MAKVQKAPIRSFYQSMQELEEINDELFQVNEELESLEAARKRHAYALSYHERWGEWPEGYRSYYSWGRDDEVAIEDAKETLGYINAELWEYEDRRETLQATRKSILSG